MEPIHILCLECSTDICSVSVSSNESVLSCIESTKNYSHGELITQYIKDALTHAGLQMKHLSGVAISSGPGSYTALRIAATVAKAICYSQDIPLIAVDSLEVLSYSLPHEKRSNCKIIPMIDARRMEVYASHFINGSLDKAPYAVVLEDNSFEGFIDSNTYVCGDGAPKSIELLQLSPSQIITESTSAQYLIYPALQRYHKNQFEDIAYYSPFYLKSPNITKSKKQLFK